MRATATWSRSIDASYSDLVEIYQKGEMLLSERRFDEAIATFTDGIHIDDQFRQRYITMYAQRGFAHLSLSNFTEAITDLSKAIEMEPEINQAQYHFQRGMCHQQLKQSDQAAADFGRSIQLHPDHPGPYHLRGKIMLETFKRPQWAIADFNKALSFQPHPEIHRLRGEARWDENDLQGALADLLRSNEIRGDPYTDFLLAFLYIELDDEDNVVDAMARAIQANPQYKQWFAQNENMAGWLGRPRIMALLDQEEQPNP